MKAERWALLCLVALSGCYQAWPFVGPYTCNLGSCPNGLVCDDGLCCRPGGAPACRTLVLDGGSCGMLGATCGAGSALCCDQYFCNGSHCDYLM